MSNDLLIELIQQVLEKTENNNKNEDISMLEKSSNTHSKSSNLLDSVVRIYCTHSQPNFAMPWQRMKQEFSTSTGFVIDNKRILTNAHSIEYGSLVQVKKRQSEDKYVATVVDDHSADLFFLLGMIFQHYHISRHEHRVQLIHNIVGVF